MTVTKYNKMEHLQSSRRSRYLDSKRRTSTVSGMWTANDCDNVDDLSSENNWAVEFKTFAQLKKYSQFSK